MSSEEIVGIFNRCVFWWLNPLFLFGRDHELQQENLPPIDSKLLSSRAAPKPHEGWNSSEFVCGIRQYTG
jgi:ATP-binding cassette subfamily C (CFTR/MRP) protein 1